MRATSAFVAALDDIFEEFGPGCSTMDSGSSPTRRTSVDMLGAPQGERERAVAFAIHVLLAAAAFLTGHAWGALWILLPGVALHFYPVLLQRSIMLRLQPFLDQSGYADVGNWSR